MDIRLIKAPSRATLDMLESRSNLKLNGVSAGALGLVQGKLIEMFTASDVAYKAAGVRVTDVKGSCPQNFIMLAIVGEMDEVKEALRNIERANKGEKEW